MENIGRVKDFGVFLAVDAWQVAKKRQTRASLEPQHERIL